MSPFKRYVNVAISNNCFDFQQQAHGMISKRNFTNCSLYFNFNLTATAFTELFQGINNLNSNVVRSVLRGIIEDCHFSKILQS